MRLLKRICWIAACGPCLAFGQTTPNPEKKLEGDAAILSNYVWHAITQTKRNPAIQTEIKYNLAPNFQIGAWGSNVSYYGRSKANAELKLLADIEFNFTQNFAMGFHFSDNHYFESDDRDGNTLGIGFDTFGYNILIEMESNWQGTVTKTRYYHVQKSWDVWTRWKWENGIGYTTFETLNKTNYFDFKSGLGTYTGVVFWQLALTFTNDNASFDPIADYFITLSAKAKF